MANSAAIKTVYGPFKNDVELIENTYDFAVDGGAVSDIDLFAFGENMVIVNAWMEVVTTCTSGGSATVAIQHAGTALQTAVAVASLTAGTVHPLALTEGTPNVLLVPRLATSSGDLGIEINVAALTAGVIKVKVQVAKAG